MTALHTIQQKLKAPKNQYNAFGKYNYRSTEDILEALKPLLAETGTYLIIEDDIVHPCNGSDIFVKATVTLYEGEKKYSATGFAKHASEQKGMQDSQITGSTSTYARKYALNGLFLIDDTKDADSSSKETKEVAAGATKPEVKVSTPVPAKKDWLNPGTKNWDAAVKRLKGGGDATIIGGTMGGVSIEKIEEFFMLSAENKDKLINEGRINEGK